MIYKNLIAIVCIAGLLAVIMTATSPNNFSAPLLFGVFSLLYLLVASGCLLMLQALRKLRVLKYSFTKMLRIAAVSAIVPVFMLLLHSVGQLTPRDIILSLAFFGLLYFYFNRVNAKGRT